MYKVFVYGKPVYLTDDLTFFRHTPHNNKAIFSDGEALEKIIKRIRSGKTISEFVIFGFDLADLWAHFQRLFAVIEAGGGVIHNAKGELLFIFRKGKWDLPKGKIDPGETIHEGAVREVMEECGLNRVELGRLLTTTYHTYTERNTKILKHTHWFEMSVPDGQKLVPQVEEDITDIRWFKPNALALVRQNTYRSVADLLDEYLKV
ncbi:MAG TPA: NUDIX domain-containing protein [Luteibaculaceae bacterium]|nr:NUDIX domain-containing protein [Luteibaculaceae bacterium]